jgi:hypothetical protein
MRNININDLSLMAKLKSDLLFILWQIEKGCQLDETDIVNDLKRTVAEFIDFEMGLSEEIVSELSLHINERE